MNEMANYEVLRDFGTRWEEADVLDWFHQRITLAVCRVSYTARGHTLEVETQVQFRHGHEDNIEIEERGSLTTDDYYLGPSPRYQAYALDEQTGALLITGKGAKTGPYKIVIYPLRRGSSGAQGH